jgi:hypothetical protein
MPDLRAGVSALFYRRLGPQPASLCCSGGGEEGNSRASTSSRSRLRQKCLGGDACPSILSPCSLLVVLREVFQRQTLAQKDSVESNRAAQSARICFTAFCTVRSNLHKSWRISSSSVELPESASIAPKVSSIFPPQGVIRYETARVAALEGRLPPVSGLGHHNCAMDCLLSLSTCGHAACICKTVLFCYTFDSATILPADCLPRMANETTKSPHKRSG